MLPKAPKHNRIKRKSSDHASPIEKSHMDRVAKMNCLKCERFGVHVHHVLIKMTWKRTRRDHACVAPLCPSCHSEIHDRVGDEQRFWAESGVNIEKWTLYQWNKSTGGEK